MTRLRAALAGIVRFFSPTHPPLWFPPLPGRTMCVGGGPANSVLIISFARERLVELGDATAAALEAGFGRCRPGEMTAPGLGLGMLPIGLRPGEGGERNAPRGRGGLGGPVFVRNSPPFFVACVFEL